MTYSFDIFDTCLIRACGSPQMVFSLIARRLCPDTAFVSDFVKRRIQAEYDAKYSLKKEAVTISEIYDCFDAESIGQTKNRMIDLEMAAEEDLLLPAHATLEKIVALHKGGRSIIFISDMYLPSIFLQKILEKFGFWNYGDKIFISGEHGVSKRSGALFRFVADTLGINFKGWHHFGDNLISDVLIPMRLGIHAHRLRHKYSRYEKLWLKNAPQSPDREMCGLLAGACRAVRIQNTYNEKINIAADVIAPAYIPYVFHVFEDARRKGFKHLYFTARDSWIFYNIAQKISSLYPEISLSYIRLSRRALWLPSLYDCDPDDFAAFGMLHNYSPYKLLTQMFGLEDKVIADNLDYDDNFLMQRLDRQSIPIFIQSMQKAGIKETLQKRSEAARGLLMRYLHQEKLPENARQSAIVDLGWGMSCRLALNKILAKEGYESIYTYYFGIISNYALYDMRNPYNSMMEMRDNVHFIPIFEHYFSLTTQSSTIGYIEDGEGVKAVFEGEDNSDCEELCRINTDNVMAVVEILSKFPDLSERISQSFLYCGAKSLNMFFKYPSRKEALIFKELSSKDIDGTNSFINTNFLQGMFGRLSGNKNIRPFWFTGSIMAACPVFGRFLCSLLMQCISSKMLKRLKARLKV
ncbi:MAG: hypothetical protein LBR84_10205 [Tannerella sp.]|jgi:FMN phosphatase YigB (HAD superfamily)|nr:hypothetical protein [Tannerella sp.]